MSDHVHDWYPDWPGAFYCEGDHGCGVRRCNHGYLAGNQCSLEEGHTEIDNIGDDCPHIFVDGECVACQEKEDE